MFRAQHLYRTVCLPCIVNAEGAPQGGGTACLSFTVIAHLALCALGPAASQVPSTASVMWGW